MGKTFTDFSQLSKGMFKKSAPVEEIKPLPKTNAVSGDDALSFFGLNAPETPTGASVGRAGDGRILALEADVRAVRAESAALEAAKAEAERKAGDLERQLAAERQMREAAEAERERLRGEVMRLRNELEDALTAPPAPSAIAAPVQEVRVDGLLRSPTTEEAFPGEVREHVLAALSDVLDSAKHSDRERRAEILGDVLSTNKADGELERRRKELRQIIKDTGSFVDARTIAAMERLGFKYVSGNKHWKIDYANVRIPMSKTPSDHRAALNTATDIANRCF